MVILYSVSYVKVKLAFDEEPSGLTNSVERSEYSPPISKVGPPSPSTSQHKCLILSSLSLTEVVVKAPVRGFNIRQDCRVDEEEPPPHRRRLQRLG